MREEFSRLLGSKDLKTALESNKLVVDAAFAILYQHGKETVSKKAYWKYDGNILYQMTILKSLSIMKLAESITYKNDIDGVALTNTYDPFAIYNIVRAQYEAFCNFNNIFIHAVSEDEVALKYYLWVLSGLNYRQRFNTESGWAKQRKEEEKTQIASLIKSVEENASFLGLDTQSKDNIRYGIKKRDWQFKIQGDKASKIAWHEMMTNAGTNEMLEDQYSFLSLNTHPSNVSVFQFETMFEKNDHIGFTRMAVQLSKVFIAMWIRDYCTYYPTCLSTFKGLPQMSQMLINSYNGMFRGEKYQLPVN